MSDYSELKKLAEAATPQDFDSAEDQVKNGYIECPHCDGQGEVELEADYCNYDNTAIGVQFYGIGNEFGAAEAYYREARPAGVLALIADYEALAAQRDEGLAREAELREWKFCPECGSEDLCHQEGRHKQCNNCYQEYWSDSDYTDVVRGHLAKLQTLQQRLAEAEKDKFGICMLVAETAYKAGLGLDRAVGSDVLRQIVDSVVARPGCAEGEKS